MAVYPDQIRKAGNEDMLQRFLYMEVAQAMKGGGTLRNAQAGG